MLLKECQVAGANILLKCSIDKVAVTEDHRFKLTSSQGIFHCDSLVIATGGLSIPTMGASDFGYRIAKQFGHQIYPTRAGLTPLTFEGRLLEKFKALAGNSINAIVSCNQTSFKEAILFTHKGLSGPAILQISNYWQAGEPLQINLLPNLDAELWLNQNKQERPDINLKTLLSTEFSQSLASFIIEEVSLNCKLKHLEHKQIYELAQFLNNWQVYPSGVEGYRVAEVTLGGVDTSQVSSKTFQSNLQHNLFFIGEVLDVTGHLGGFNFQWAWASGYAAGGYV